MKFRAFQLLGAAVITTLAIITISSVSTFSSTFPSWNFPNASGAQSRIASVAIELNPSGDSLAPDVFSPYEIIVKKKTTVTWTNNDPIRRHTVTEGVSPAYEETPEGYNPAFNSEIIQPGGTFSYTFEKKGEYEYYCSIHPFVTGKVVVGKEEKK
jgi:plastocyanin